VAVVIDKVLGSLSQFWWRMKKERNMANYSNSISSAIPKHQRSAKTNLSLAKGTML